jgi:hypothetical protein
MFQADLGIRYTWKADGRRFGAATFARSMMQRIGDFPRSGKMR